MKTGTDKKKLPRSGPLSRIYKVLGNIETKKAISEAAREPDLSPLGCSLFDMISQRIQYNYCATFIIKTKEDVFYALQFYGSIIKN